MKVVPLSYYKKKFDEYITKYIKSIIHTNYTTNLKHQISCYIGDNNPIYDSFKYYYEIKKPLCIKIDNYIYNIIINEHKSYGDNYIIYEVNLITKSFSFQNSIHTFMKQE